MTPTIDADAGHTSTARAQWRLTALDTNGRRVQRYFDNDLDMRRFLELAVSSSGLLIPVRIGARTITDWTEVTLP